MDTHWELEAGQYVYNVERGELWCWDSIDNADRCVTRMEQLRAGAGRIYREPGEIIVAFDEARAILAARGI
jgi:hypothetical protein